MKVRSVGMCLDFKIKKKNWFDFEKKKKTGVQSFWFDRTSDLLHLSHPSSLRDALPLPLAPTPACIPPSPLNLHPLYSTSDLREWLVHLRCSPGRNSTFPASCSPPSTWVWVDGLSTKRWSTKSTAKSITSIACEKYWPLVKVVFQTRARVCEGSGVDWKLVFGQGGAVLVGSEERVEGFKTVHFFWGSIQTRVRKPLVRHPTCGSGDVWRVENQPYEGGRQNQVRVWGWG